MDITITSAIVTEILVKLIKTKAETPPRHSAVLICQYLSSLDNINTPLSSVHEILHCVITDDGI